VWTSNAGSRVERPICDKSTSCFLMTDRQLDSLQHIFHFYFYFGQPGAGERATFYWI
jgi:hypothetical protein